MSAANNGCKGHVPSLAVALEKLQAVAQVTAYGYWQQSKLSTARYTPSRQDCSCSTLLGHPPPLVPPTAHSPASCCGPPYLGCKC